MEKNSKIYVAGHNGLVGSAIWKNLQSKGYINLIGRTFAELDLRNQQAVSDFFALENPEYVILAAAKVGGIMANNVYRGEFIYENLMVQNNVIHQAYVNGVKKLLFLGSTCIYPKEAPQPMKEEYLLTGPLEHTNEPYAIAKIAGIKLCESYNIQYGTNFISVMPTNLYGPNDNFDLEKSHVLPALLRKVHLGKLLEDGNFAALAEDLQKEDAIKETLSGIGVSSSIPRSSSSSFDSPVTRHPSLVTVEIWGSGIPMREFMWSEDMADACVYLMELDNRSSVIPTKVWTQSQTAEASFVNIGTGIEISIRDLAHLVKKIVGFKGELIFNASKPDGTMRKVTDVSRLHSLGWKHKVNLEEGIVKYYQWYLDKAKGRKAEDKN
ncbi:MAG: GDP-L-fucose synthase [Candidatus Omnitrophota bacterium]